MSTAIESNPGASTSTSRPSPKPKRQPPYAVILYNDNVNSFEFVIETIQKVFGFQTGKAIELMLEAHHTGRSLLWSGMKEHAEFKADQVRSCGSDPDMTHLGARPLRVSIEPQQV
ncbi:MAG: ATP-dependent Clp protease adaptor ClpS [Phycisphaerales bacterium]|nr:ATP-dependent Clp protease adaptor ClpS [Phycisphaerales bacterium]